MFWLEACVALIFILFFLFVRIPLWLWTSLVCVWFAGQQYFFNINDTVAVVMWGVILTLALIFNFPFLRKKIVTARLVNFCRKLLPVISPTEQAALDAGDVWWEAKLLQGMPNWSQLLSYKENQLTNEEQSFIDNQVSEFCSLLDSWQINKNKDLPKIAWDYIKKEKFFGLLIPKEYGGLGFSAYAQSCVVTKIATQNLNAAVTVMVPNSLGPAELLLHYGTDEQKQQYLERLATAQEIPCFALTAPEAGSDAGAIPDKGIVCEEEYLGEKTLGIKLTWNKRYITLAPIATVLGLAFKMFDPDNLLGKGTNLGITLCLVPTDHPGVTIGKRHLPAGGSFMNGPTSGESVFVPLDWIIGGVERIGQGWKMLMECLAAGRGISLPALSAAFSTRAYKTTSAYAKIRQQFNCPIGKFEGVQEALGKIGGHTYIIEAARRMTAFAIDSGCNPAVVTAIAKYQMTELGRESVKCAMDINAGKAVIEGPENYIAEFYRIVPVAITVEGANILTRSLIIFGQGAIRCHPYILKEVEGLQNSDKNLGLTQFDGALFSHVGYTLSNTVRAFVLSLTNGHAALNIDRSDKILTPYLKKLSRMSTSLSIITDMALIVLGGNLKRMESLSARLGDVLSNLYLASAVIYYYKQVKSTDAEDLYLHWSLSFCLYNMQTALAEFLDNFPNKYLGKIAHAIIFPFGLPFKTPKDKWTHGIAESMLKKSSIRERLTEIHFSNPDLDSAVENLEQAFVLESEIEPIIKKMKAAIKNNQIAKASMSDQIEESLSKKVISKSESALLKKYETKRQRVIAVDEFDSKDLSNEK